MDGVSAPVMAIRRKPMKLMFLSVLFMTSVMINLDLGK